MRPAIHRAVAIAACLVVLEVTAQTSMCPPAPIPDPNSCSLQGDPVVMGYNNTYYNSTDFTVRTSLGDVPFERFYIGTQRSWADWTSSVNNVTSGVPAPFGHFQNNPGLLWWHTFFSMVDQESSQTFVRDLQGVQSEWSTCSPGGTSCWVPHTSESPGEPGALRRFPSAYEYHHKNGSTLVYDKILNSRLIFLGQVVNPDGQVLARLSYKQPTGCGSYSDGGIPYIDRVVFAPDGSDAGHQLMFAYSPHADGGCVISSLTLRPYGTTGSADEVVASYSMTSDGGSGEIAAIVRPDSGVLETYDYSRGQNGFGRARGGTYFTQHYSTDGGFSVSSVDELAQADAIHVTGQNSGNAANYLDTFLNNQACPPASSGGNQLTGSTFSGLGSGSNTSAVSMQSYFLSINGYQKMVHTTLQIQRQDIMSVAEAGADGIIQWIYRDNAPVDDCVNRPGALIAVKDKRDVYFATPHRLVSPDAGPAANPTLEKLADIAGAIDADGGGRLMSRNYSYGYGPNGDQHVINSFWPSVAGSGDVTRSFLFDGQKPVGLVDEGYSTLLSDAGVHYYRGVFAFNQSSCSGTTSAVDPFNRTLRLEGPCFVGSAAATDCHSTNASYPVTEFEYYGASGGSNAHRLHKVLQYPANAGDAGITNCGTSAAPALVTEYVTYDPRGNPLQMTDAAGVTHNFEYQDGHLTHHSVTVNGSVQDTFWKYENDVLVQVKYPKGNTETYCYHGTGHGSSCTGAFQKLLQWKAKGDSSGGSLTERVDYYYWSDETLQREVFSDANGASTRLEHNYSADAEKRLTWESFGGSGGTVKTKRRFDASDNQVAVGRPATGAPDFCTSNSLACAWMVPDRAGRLAELDAYPAGAADAGTKTCFDYDAHGNIRQVAMGIAAPGVPSQSTSDCSDFNTSKNTGTETRTPPVDYEVDDFGNTTAVTFPWTGKSTRALTRYEYDAMGNVTRKQTEAMRSDGYWLEYAYDTLGRLLTSKRNDGTLLYQLAYDGNNWPSGLSCGGALSNAKGRLSLRVDSFGSTYYRYDENGRVLKEVRLRSTSDGSCYPTSDRYNFPHTAYSYDANGNLASIVYPLGREVDYAYYGGALADRVGSIGVYVFGSGMMSLIDNVAWEPYGGLRGYQIVQSNQWVEYFQGGNLETLPTDTACSSLPADDSSPSDNSGRIRALLVSDSFSDMGYPNGAIFKQLYTWKGDQLVGTHTCYLNDGPVIGETFGYDNMERLTNYATDGGTGYISEVYDYDLRGNRQRLTTTGAGACTITSQSTAAAGGSSHQVDLQANRQWSSGSCNGAVGRYNQTYDKDGRVSQIVDGNSLYSLTPAYSNASIGEGLDSVYNAMSITGGSSTNGTYSYYYDAFGRRTAKTTPWSSTDEYFYDLGHQLLSDRGTDNIGASPGEYPVDEYVWLGGRPVIIYRGKFNTTWVRQNDDTGSCPRNGSGSWQYTTCASRYPVTDYLGKPVVMLAGNNGMLDGAGGISSIGRYQAYGMANRRESHYASPHNVSANLTVMTINENMPPNFDGTVKVLFNYIDYPSNSTQGTIAFNGVTQSLHGAATAHVWSTAEGWSSGWALTWNSGTRNPKPYGFDVEGYHANLKQWGVYAFWTPLRFPGQYFDEETDLVENWNRYYEPSTGRYLSPEPMLQRSAVALANAQGGYITPVYAYAANNPVNFVDPSGRRFEGNSEAWETLTPLIADPVLGPLLDAMEKSDTVFNLDFTHQVTADLNEHMGAYNMGARTPPQCGGTKTDVYVTINPAMAALEMKAQGWPMTPEMTLAHELGAVYGRWSGAKAPQEFNWENRLRGAGPHRETH